jgi:hypothetical protein
MPTFVIHIGPHKTGSSYLQSALAALEDRLRARGVMYPTDLGNKGHNLLPQKLSEPAAHPRLAAQMRSYCGAKYDKVILTSEELGRLEEPQIRVLGDMIAGHPVQVVFYCRSWGSVCASHWNQQVRQGSAVPLDELLTRHMTHPRRSSVINFGRKWERWAAVFGKASLNLISLEGLAQAKLDTLAHFADRFLGIGDLPETDPAFRRNQSMPLAEAEMVRALNQMRMERTGERDSTIAHRFTSRKATLGLEPVLAAVRGCEDRLAFDETGLVLARLHQRLFRAYGDRLVAPAPAAGGQFFTPKLQQIPFIRADYLTMPGVGGWLEGIYGRLAEMAAA